MTPRQVSKDQRRLKEKTEKETVEKEYKLQKEGKIKKNKWN